MLHWWKLGFIRTASGAILIVSSIYGPHIDRPTLFWPPITDLCMYIHPVDFPVEHEDTATKRCVVCFFASLFCWVFFTVKFDPELTPIPMNVCSLERHYALRDCWDLHSHLTSSRNRTHDRSQKMQEKCTALCVASVSTWLHLLFPTRNYVNITDNEQKIIMASRLSIFIYNDSSSVNKNNENFDVPMGVYDSGKISDLVCLFILDTLSRFIDPKNVGLYRDDGLIVISNSNGSLTVN